MKTLKYIITEDEFDNEVAILFPLSIIHGTLKMYCPRLKAAGFVQVITNNNQQTVNCYGESTSLGLESRGEIDAKIIHKLIFG